MEHDIKLPIETPSTNEDGVPLSLGLQLVDGEEQRSPLTLRSLEVVGQQRVFRVPTIEQRLDLSLDHVVTLLGYDLPRKKAQPGDSLDLTLYWRAEASMERSYTVFVHLLAEDDSIQNQIDRIPRSDYPTSAWAAGEVIEDVYELPLAADTPAGTYSLEIGMYDAASGKRLPMVDADGTPLEGDRLLVEDIGVQAP